MKNIMKNKVLLTFLLWLILASNISYADIQPNIVVSSFSIKEGVANVGKEFALLLNLTNTGTSACAKSITTSVEAGFPFIIDGISTLPIGDLCSGTKDVQFPMKIDPTANGGFYQIKVSNTYQSATYIQFSSSNTLNIFVNGTPEINANIINSEPIDIYPGDTGTLAVKIENDGSFQAQSLSAVMESAKPIEVKWSKSFNSIELLEPKQSKTVEFAVEVPKDAEAKAYPLTMGVNYYDENRFRQTKIFNFNLYVKKKAEFETFDSGSDSLYANQASRNVRVLLKNTGTDAARKLKAKIIPQFPFSTDGSVRYIELLDVGASNPIDFTVDVDKDAKPGQYSLDMLVDFEDAQGKKFQDTAQVVLNVRQKGIIRAVFLDYWFLWLIALAIATLIVRKKYTKTKK